MHLDGKHISAELHTLCICARVLCQNRLPLPQTTWHHIMHKHTHTHRACRVSRMQCKNRTTSKRKRACLIFSWNKFPVCEMAHLTRCSCGGQRIPPISVWGWCSFWSIIHVTHTNARTTHTHTHKYIRSRKNIMATSSICVCMHACCMVHYVLCCAVLELHVTIICYPPHSQWQWETTQNNVTRLIEINKIVRQKHM